MPRIESPGGSGGGSGITNGEARLSTVEGGQAYSRLSVFGQSYTEGTGLTVNSARWSSKLARRLRVEEVNYGISGAILGVDDTSGTNNNPGGIIQVLNGLRPQANITSGDRTAAPYLPPSDLTVLQFGFNDIAFVNSSLTPSINGFKAALRAAICRARTGGLFENTHGSIAYSGASWSGGTYNGTVSGSTAHLTTTAGATATITVPADFPGGEIDLGIAAPGVNQGCLYTITLDGGAHGTHDTRAGAMCGAGANSKFNGTVYRLTGLAAGAHTIVLTATTLESGGFGLFDYWAIASQDKPLVVLPNQPHIPVNYTGGTHNPVTNSDIDTLNTAIAAVAAEFDSMVVVANVDAAFSTADGSAIGSARVANGSPKSLYGADNLHPNERGHSIMEAAIEEAIFRAPAPRQVSTGAVHWRKVLANGSGDARPNGYEPALKSGWTIFGSGFSVPSFRKDADGWVHLMGTVVNSSATPATPAIFTLPKGYLPVYGQSIPTMATGETLGEVQVDGSSGDVRWNKGAANGYFTLDDISFPADA